MYYKRIIEKEIIEDLVQFPVVAILGPRQSGKTTLAKYIIKNKIEKETVYLDLERPSDLNKLDDSEWYFVHNKESLICIDEIQRKPELFPLIRSLTDEWGESGHFLILGSASKELIKQSSESLAGRISYHHLTPLLFEEIKKDISLENYMIKGGFPRSILSSNINKSNRWRENFINTFIERDVLQWSSIRPQSMRRLLQMLAHVNGQLLNYSQLGNSLGMSNASIKKYIDLLEGAWLIERIPPWLENQGKRIIKSHKLYFKDTGLLNSLLALFTLDQAMGHPAFGAMWESMVLINLMADFPLFNFFHYRTSHGAELDFVIEYAGKLLAVECKASKSPHLSKGAYSCMADINVEKMLVISPVNSGWRMKENIFLVSIEEAQKMIAMHFATSVIPTEVEGSR